MTNIVSALALESLPSLQGLDLYSEALCRAFEKSPPPYGFNWFANDFRRKARDPSWFAGLLVSNADLEGYSAAQLWNYAKTLTGEVYPKEMERHAADEARHSRMFANLLFTLFPHMDDEEGRHKLAAMAPNFQECTAPKLDEARDFEEVLNAAILINLHEVKALILEKLLEPILLIYSKTEDRARVQRSCNILIRDEIQHINYSAHFIERAANSGYRDYVIEAVEDFQRTLNLVTVEEVEQDQLEGVKELG